MNDMKLTDTLTMLFSHHLWANLRLLEHCAELTDEQLNATISGSFGSIQDTLQHIVTSEESYFSRISTGQPFNWPEETPPMSIADMTAVLRKTGAGLIEWAPKVKAKDTVLLDWNGTPREVPKTIILTQVINHATEHRAQVMAILTELGIQSPNLQSWPYFAELDK
jgi:uncharacterized damage-inducible protein DinB